MNRRTREPAEEVDPRCVPSVIVCLMLRQNPTFCVCCTHHLMQSEQDEMPKIRQKQVDMLFRQRVYQKNKRNVQIV